MKPLFENCLKLSAAFLLTAIISGYAFGSVVLFTLQRDHVVVAADSRQHLGDWTNDEVCKVIQIGPRSFFAETGAAIASDTITHRELWSGFSVLRDAFKQYPEMDGTNFIRLIATWAEMMRVRYQDVLVHKPDKLSGQGPRGAITDAIFGIADPSAMRAYYARLGYALPPLVDGPYAYFLIREANAGELPLFSAGDPAAIELATEFLSNQTERAKSGNVKYLSDMTASAPDYEPRRLKAAIEFAIEWIPDKRLIGGPVDVMSIERGGTVRWIARKKECAKADPQR